MRKGEKKSTSKTSKTTITKGKLPPEMNLQTRSVISYHSENNPHQKYDKDKDIGPILQKRWNLNRTCGKTFWESRKGRGIS